MSGTFQTLILCGGFFSLQRLVDLLEAAVTAQRQAQQQQQLCLAHAVRSPSFWCRGVTVTCGETSVFLSGLHGVESNDLASDTAGTIFV